MMPLAYLSLKSVLQFATELVVEICQRQWLPTNEPNLVPAYAFISGRNAARKPLE